jgi:hypothetical protein
MKKVIFKGSGKSSSNGQLVIKFSSESIVNPVVLPF